MRDLSVRALVLRRVVEAARSSLGIELHAESLSYNLLTLSTELRGIRLAALDTPAVPFATADTLAISFGAQSHAVAVATQTFQAP